MSKKRRDTFYRKLLDVPDDKTVRIRLPVNCVLRLRMATAEFFDHPLDGDGRYEMDMRQLIPKGERLFPIQLWSVDEQQSRYDCVMMHRFREDCGRIMDEIILRLTGKMSFDDMCRATVEVIRTNETWLEMSANQDAEFHRRTPESMNWTIPCLLA